MKEKAKESAFFVAMFLLIVWLLSFLAPSDATTTPDMQNVFAELSAVDWMMVFIAIGAIPLTLLTVYYLQTREASAPQLQPEWGRGEAMEAEQNVIPAPMEERPIIVNGASPELVNRIKRESAEWERKYKELLATHQSAPEPAVERELTYGAVAALIKSGGRLGINEAQKVVRAHGGVAGRDYKPLQEVLLLLAALSPTVSSTPIHEQKQAVDSQVYGKCSPSEERVNRATGRSLPRRKGREKR